MIITRLSLLFLICKGVVSFVRLPCLTNESIDFEDSRKALTNLVSFLETTFKNIKQRIRTLNKDLQMLQDDFKKVTWKKYNGHCYHYGTKKVPWFAAENHITGWVLLIFKKANGVGVMTNLMLPLKNGIPDMEIEEHQRIVLCITSAIQNGLTTLVKAHFILFVRVISAVA